MKKILVLTAICACLLLMISWRETGSESNAQAQIRSLILDELTQVVRIIDLSKKNLNNPQQLKKCYFQARKHYKACEFFIEYTSPKEAKYYINGPSVPKHDPDFGSKVFYPNGFQHIEEILFKDESIKPDTALLRQEYVLLQTNLQQLIEYYKEISIDEAQVLEMFQLELVRIASLNISGYDATIIQNNISEVKWSLEGISKALNCYKLHSDQSVHWNSAWTNLHHKLQKTNDFLKSDNNYNTFNRLKFITNYLSPLNSSLIDFHNASNLKWTNHKQAINLQNKAFLSANAFNKQYFSIYYDDKSKLDLQAALGKILFNEPMLSGTNINSCASCHRPDQGFAGGMLKQTGSVNTTLTSRNTPGLLNVMFQQAFFYDGRAYQLEQQVFDVIHNKNEMNSTLDDIVLKLRDHPAYRILFNQAFVNTADSAITGYAVQKALSEYEKTLVAFNSRFDQYLNGDQNALCKEEISGYNLFAGKAMCGSCHFFPLFNGTVPPFYTDSEFEVIGVPLMGNDKMLDPDLGRYIVTGVEEHKFAFKTPTVRNIELTAPYMHNGVFNTLEQVVDFYHKGGGSGLKLLVPNQTLPFDVLKLNEQEKKDIVKFMKSLTDVKFSKKGRFNSN